MRTRLSDSRTDSARASAWSQDRGRAPQAGPPGTPQGDLVEQRGRGRRRPAGPSRDGDPVVHAELAGATSTTVRADRGEQARAGPDGQRRRGEERTRGAGGRRGSSPRNGPGVGDDRAWPCRARAATRAARRRCGGWVELGASAPPRAPPAQLLRRALEAVVAGGRREGEHAGAQALEIPVVDRVAQGAHRPAGGRACWRVKTPC